MPVITFLPDNKTIGVSDYSSLLDAAKAALVHAETPCGGRGLCRKCTVQVVSGEVEFDNNGSLPDALINDGYVLLCKAKIKTSPLQIKLFSQENEQGKFTKTESDLALVDNALLPQKDFSPVVKMAQLKVQAPEVGDGLSDADRFVKAAAGILGQEPQIPLCVLRALPEALRADGGRVTIHYTENKNSIAIVDIAADSAAEDYGIAVDIGTTTVAVQLVRIADGEIIGASTKYNAQVACGLDIISRINYAKKPERLVELKEKVLSTINVLIEEISQTSGISRNNIMNASVAGNTTMIHLLLGIMPEYIRLEPYTPAVYTPQFYKAEEIGLMIHPETPVYIAPGVGSYVGGDITSGMLCTPMSTEAEEISLFIDIGTNGEMVLGNSDFLIGCACSAGPAFEGGGIEKGMRASQGAVERVEVDEKTGLAAYSTIGGAKAVGICGSGMISLIAGLFRTGWIDPSGRLNSEKSSPAVYIEGRKARYIVDHARSGGKGEIYITEADIENLIRAKAAIYSACRVMLKKAGMEFNDISKVYIAGGFGRYLDIGNAITIGLIPDLPEERYIFLGNASVSGAYMTLLSGKHRVKQQSLAKKVTYLDLSTEHEYMNEYTAALFLPHTDESLFKKPY